MKENIMLNSQETAKYLNISTTELYRIKNEMPFTKIGNKLLFNKEHIDIWLLSKTNNIDMLVDNVKQLLDKYNKDFEVLKYGIQDN